MRLELLQGVAAYHSGDKGLARARLKASQARWQQLQVSDERLAELLSMGFDAQEVTFRISIPELMTPTSLVTAASCTGYAMRSGI